METDGKIIIETELDNKKFDKQLKDLERELKSYDKKNEALLKQRQKYVETSLKGYYETLKTYKGGFDEELGWKRSAEEIENLKKYGMTITPKLYERLKGQQDEVYKNELSKLAHIDKQIAENNQKREQTIDLINRTKEATEEAGESEKDLGNKIEKNTRTIDFNFKKLGSKIKRYGLALLSLRTSYALVSRASSAYLSQDVELAEN